MIRSGLVSVTFRERTCEDVIRLAQAARLELIEWHGRDHVPHGDLHAARRIGELTREAGLGVAAYGSYYTIGESDDEGLSFTTVLQTAKQLGAPMVRVWAGRRNPEAATPVYRARIVNETRRIADLAASDDIRVVVEFHAGTLTKTGASCAALLEAVDHPNVRTYWQPRSGLDANENLSELGRVVPWLVGLHVFQWRPTDADRRPLADGESEWARYLALASRQHGTLNALLEFVRGDAEQQFREDAAALRNWLAADRTEGA